MIPDIVIAMLAIIKLGANFLPLFSGFGPDAIISRLNDAEAKILFTADGSLRRGKITLLKPIADQAAVQVPSLRHIIAVNAIGPAVQWKSGFDLWWHDLTAQTRDASPTHPTDRRNPVRTTSTSQPTRRP